MTCVFNPPSPLNICSGNVSENFKSWKRFFEIYLKASKNDAATVPEATKVAILLQCAGPDVIKIYDQFEFDPPDDKDKLSAVLEKLEQYCNPLKNEVVASHRFWTLEYYIPFDTYLTDLKSLAAECNFGTLTNRLIRDKLVFVMKGNLQARLLRETDLTLDKAIQICRVEEITIAHSKILDTTKTVDRVQTNKNHTETYDSKYRILQYNCKFCGSKHEASKEHCPAYGKECKKCGLRNHFMKCCKKRQVHVVTEETDDVPKNYWLGAITRDGAKTIRAQMIVNNCNVFFELDSGAEVNTIQQKYVLKSQVLPTKINLKMWNNSESKPLGETQLEVKKSNNWRNIFCKFRDCAE